MYHCPFFGKNVHEVISTRYNIRYIRYMNGIIEIYKNGINVNKIYSVNIWSRGQRSGIDLEIEKEKRILSLSIFGNECP